MPSFVLVDQSLRSVGGHPFDYAVHVLSAAEQAGYQPVLATHRKFRNRNSLPRQFKVLPCFRHSTYSRFALYCAGPQLPPPIPGMVLQESSSANKREASWLQAIWLWFYNRARERQLRSFSKTCSQLFSTLNLQPGDHVFFATISEFEFIALSQFLGSADSASSATWHLQFHFNIFEGRPPEYASQQDRLNWVRQCLNLGWPLLQRVHLRFYNTSQQLAEQYIQLGLAKFRNLPYPVNPSICPSNPSAAEKTHGPLRVTCAGGVRNEKGQTQLATTLGSVWSQLFLSGKLQLHVQSKPSHRNRLGLPAPESAAVSQPVVFWPHPLSPENYTEFIRESHIGLLLYNSRRYYARRAGVLGEFLCAGVPVLVPSGCWLSEQIAEAGFSYLDHVSQLPSMAGTEDVSLGELVIPPQSETEHVLEVPSGASALLISVTGHSWPPGTYLGISVLEHSKPEGTAPKRSLTQVITTRDGARPSRALWRLQGEQSRVTLSLRDEYEGGGFVVETFHVKWISSSKSLPLSAVGIGVAEETDVGFLLSEIAEHYEHYKSTALKFSETWRPDHDPMKTVQVLTEN